MKIYSVILKLLAFGCIIKQTNTLVEKSHSAATDGFSLRRYGSITIFNIENETSVRKLNVCDKMPKRVRSTSVQKSKKARQTLDLPPNKRTPIPRSCKSTTPKRKSIVNFDFLSINTSKIVMGANQVKRNEKEKEKEMADMSGEDLDVVFDLQEEKKNKIYEVITVMSDDETPNEISYERIYADDPEKRIVHKSELPDKPIDIFNNSDIVGEVVKEANQVKEKTLVKMKEEDSSFKTVPVINYSDSLTLETKDDSDSEVVCVAVLDAKTKAEQKKASIEEICLSSDSENESQPKVPPLKLQLPISSYPYINDIFHRSTTTGNGNSFDSNNSNFSLGFGRARIYPYIYGSKQSDNYCPNNSVTNFSSNWDSYSTSAKASSSDEFSPAPSESPKVLSGDESSSSVLSDLSLSANVRPQRNLSPSSGNENSSSPSSSSDEEKDIYWKVDRESRRKRDLRYEEYTDLGKKIHEGEVLVNSSNSYTFKVMSYNVLAQNLLEQHRYLYKNNDHRALVWSRRWSSLYNEIKDENPEILCIQELEQTHLSSHFAKLTDLGYRWIYKKRTSTYKDGVAVFYKTSVFQAETHSAVEFYQPGVSVLDRDNVGVVVRLRLKNSPNHAVVIATTHLLYNPRRSDVKLAQTQVLLAEIDRVAYNKDAFTYYPVILTGDFNLKPRNGVYKLITEGQILYEGMSRKTLREPDDNNVLPRMLLPRRLGVTDRCQHVDVIDARVCGEDTTRTRLYHSELNTTHTEEDENANGDSAIDDRFESGTLCHGFNFQSVYPHIQQDGQKEASTHHDNWITVDYIFYSTPKIKEGQEKEEGSLQLISRLRLPTQDECNTFLRHLPNFAFGSDHLPLVGKFFLRLH